MKFPFFNKKEDRSNITNPQRWLIEYLTRSNESTTGIKVTPEKAIQVSAVFAAINLIAQTMASMPLVVYENTKQGRRKAIEHPLYNMLHNLPNKETTAAEFWIMYIINLLLTKYAFAYIERDQSNRVISIDNIPTKNVKIHKNKNTNETYYEFEYEGEKMIVYSENMLVTKGLQYSSKDPLDPVSMAREALGLNIALETYAGNYFKNGANPGGVVTTPGKMSDTAFQRFKDSFNEKFSGIGNSSKVVFLESGSDYKTVTTSPKDSQSIESRKFQVIEIARYFNVPPHKIMDLERATFSNIEQQNIDFVISCLSPLAKRIEQSIYRDLLSTSEKKKYYVKFNFNSLLRGDTQSRKEYYQSGIQNGYLSPNDVRELEDMNIIEDGDVYMVNSTLINLKSVKKGGEMNEENGN